ncbi:MAG: hypothetical protein AAF502_00160 [Bacteroidota bacterium]
MAKKSTLGFLIKKIPAPLRNKYLVAIAVFVVWIVFFDKNNIIAQWQLQNTEHEMLEKKAFYEKEIKVVEDEHNNMNTIEEKERIAREKYMMKKNNEDIYVIVEEE